MVLGLIIKELSLAALLISSERRLVSLADSKHLHDGFLAGFEVPRTEAGVGVLERVDLERDGGRGGSWRERRKFKVDELFTAANNRRLTYSHLEHPKL